MQAPVNGAGLLGETDAPSSPLPAVAHGVLPAALRVRTIGRPAERGLAAAPEVSRAKKAEREARLAQRPEWRLRAPVPPELVDVSALPTSQLTPREREIVHQDATALAAALRARRYTAVEVLEAFCHAATIAQDLTNCLTEVLFEEGLRRAAELDRHLAETGDVVGPLHGVPVSIKDHILVEGHDTATGYAAWAFRTVAARDAVVVDVLRKAGAVIYVKTANPQTLLSLETNNNIYGRTLNPHNRALTPGGSSGGESALIAVHGSPLGVGTDIGGSIRVPAGYMGLYGLKGSVGRMPHGGLMGSHDGMDAIVGALGPLATSARDLALFARVMLANEPWLAEPPLLELPWRQDVADGSGVPAKLTVAVLWDDGVVAPHPPIVDALARGRDALRAAGHDVISWEPVDHQAAWDLILKLYFLDGGEEYRQVLAEDPPVPQTEWILGQVPNGGAPYGVADVFKINLEREAFRAKVLAHWNAHQARTASGRHIDAVLSPVAATLAPRHDRTRWWGYTSYWNLMDYPAVVFPVGRFRAAGYAGAQLPEGASVHVGDPRSETERVVRAEWDPATYDNIPVSLQLVGRRLNEERLLGVLGKVEDALSRFRDH
ncbi:general amidase GmdA [Lenzites betulinus]|nr:general amidase GmdA [Lenzites betulinus]